MHSMGGRLANFPDRILTTRLLATGGSGQLMSGELDSSGDNIALFSDSHLAPIGSSTTQSNMMTGTTSSAFCAGSAVQTVAQQILNDFRVALAQIRGILDDQGQPWHDDDIKSENITILCSPLLEAPMKQAFFSHLINASDNIMKGMVKEVITTNYFPSTSTSADAADWHIFINNNMQKPILYSRFRRITDDEIEDRYSKYLTAGSDHEKGIRMEDLRELSSVRLETNMGHQGMNADSDVMDNDRFQITAQFRGEIFGGEWRNGFKVNNSAA